uniref:(northern house mosquito) hypothetical protein n=1 Tax=Culex pipiens TaxID=7175 RepID=A0A8D8BD32_CULPI
MPQKIKLQSVFFLFSSNLSRLGLDVTRISSTTVTAEAHTCGKKRKQLTHRKHFKPSFPRRGLGPRSRHCSGRKNVSSTFHQLQTVYTNTNLTPFQRLPLLDFHLTKTFFCRDG